MEAWSDKFQYFNGEPDTGACILKINKCQKYQAAKIIKNNDLVFITKS